jgi:hypothetical protein
LGNIATGLSYASSVSFSPDGNYFAVGFYGASPNLQVWETKELASKRYSVKELENAYGFELDNIFYLQPPG